MPLLEFIVDGTPRSLQGSARGIEAWKEVVRAAAGRAIPEDARAISTTWRSSSSITASSGATNDGDLDNIAKPILDAMCGIAIFNDNQVRQLTLRRTDLQQHNLTQVAGASPMLAGRLERAVIDQGPSCTLPSIATPCMGDCRDRSSASPT